MSRALYQGLTKTGNIEIGSVEVENMSKMAPKTPQEHTHTRARGINTNLLIKRDNDVPRWAFGGIYSCNSAFPSGGVCGGRGGGGHNSLVCTGPSQDQCKENMAIVRNQKLLTTSTQY